MDAHVDERAEPGDVGHHAFQDHPLGQVRKLVDPVGKLGHAELLARVAPRLFQLGQDVLDGRQPHRLVDERARVELAEKGRVADQLAGRHAGRLGHVLDDVVAFRVDGRIVQRLGASAHAQEAGALLEGLAAQARHLAERPAPGERTVLVAVAADRPGQLGPDARDVRKQRGAGRVEVHADPVDARLDVAVQGLAKPGLVDVVLVLADADRLGIDLDQLGQRVLEPPGDADRAAHGHVQVGKLGPGQLAGRVDRRPRLVDADLGRRELVLLDHGGHKRVGLARGRARADGDQLDAVPLDELAQHGSGLVGLALRRRGVDRGVFQELAGGVHHGHLAAGAEAGVDAQHHALPGRRGQQQVAEVLREDADRLVVGRFLHLAEDGRLDRGKQQPRVAVGHGLDQFGAELEPRIGDQPPGEPGHQRVLVHLDAHAQHPFGLAAPHGQEAVRGDLGQRLAVVVVHLELAGLLLPVAADLGGQRAPLHLLAEPLAHVEHLGPLLGHDVAGAPQSGLGVGHLGLGVDERAHDLVARLAAVLLALQIHGQRLQAAPARDGRPRPPLGLVGQVELLQLLLVPALEDLAPQRVVELALLLDRLEDRGFAVGQLALVGQRVLHRAQRGLVQPAGVLLAVPGDEGDRVPFGQKLGRGQDLRAGQAAGRRNFPGGPVQIERNGGRFAHHLTCQPGRSLNKRSIIAAAGKPRK